MIRIKQFLSKLFEREPTYQEVAIKKAEARWDEHYRKIEVKNKWDERRRNRLERTKEEAYLGIKRYKPHSSISEYDYLKLTQVRAQQQALLPSYLGNLQTWAQRAAVQSYLTLE